MARNTLYRIAWNWHFWTGLLITPVFIVASVTGALFVFQPQVDRWLEREWRVMSTPEPGADAWADAALSAFEAQVEATHPDYALRFVNFDPDPTREWEGILQGRRASDTLPTLHAYFDPYAQKLLGTIDRDPGFMAQTRLLHRNLWIGTPGRLMVELATCWGIISTLLGLWLWWPRGKERLWGVWLPRSRGRLRVVLRDWHTVPGVWVAPFAILVLLSGLLFSPVWGILYQVGNAVTSGFPDTILSPPLSSQATGPDAPRISIEDALARAESFAPFRGTRFSMEIPRPETDGSFLVMNTLKSPFDPLAGAFIDAVSGEIIASQRKHELPKRAVLTLLFYPTHVGSIFGLPTQILAVVVCVIFTTSGVTGVWLWWRRRPAGRFGAPRPVDGDLHPRWLFWLTVVFGVFFPVVGVTLVGIAAVEWGRGRFGAEPA
ncbi:MAG: PepSY domain-containing protein [Myxococcota bacterium]